MTKEPYMTKDQLLERLNRIAECHDTMLRCHTLKDFDFRMARAGFIFEDAAEDYPMPTNELANRGKK